MQCDNKAEVANITYCGVTKSWTPTTSKPDGDLKIAFMLMIPAVICLVMLLITLIVWSFRVYHDVKELFSRLKDVYFIREYTTHEDYHGLKTLDVDLPLSFNACRRWSRFSILGEESKLPDLPLDTNTFKISGVTKGEVEAAEKFGTCCKLIVLPKGLGFVHLVSRLIVSPLSAIFMGFVDIFVNAYYFYQYKNSDFLDRNITRSGIVSNLLYVFILLSTVKYFVVACCYITLLKDNRADRNQRNLSTRKIMFATSMKVLLDEVPAMLLEYFFIDKYRDTELTSLLIARNLISFIFYIVPVIGKIKPYCKNFRSLRNDEKTRPMMRLCYILCTVGIVFMSIAVISRVVGMLTHSSSDIREQCLTVDNGSLLQVPFNSGCMSVCDQFVLIFTILALEYVSVPCFFLLCFHYRSYWW